MICPNCKGDGYEDNPPMRKCGICKGTGRVPDPAPVKGVDPAEKSRSAPAQEQENGEK